MRGLSALDSLTADWSPIGPPLRGVRNTACIYDGYCAKDVRPVILQTRSCLRFVGCFSCPDLSALRCYYYSVASVLRVLTEITPHTIALRTYVALLLSFVFLLQFVWRNKADYFRQCYTKSHCVFLSVSIITPRSKNCRLDKLRQISFVHIIDAVGLSAS